MLVVITNSSSFSNYSTVTDDDTGSSKHTKIFTHKSDQHINSPYNFNTLSSRQVMRIKKIIN